MAQGGPADAMVDAGRVLRLRLRRRRHLQRHRPRVLRVRRQVRMLNRLARSRAVGIYEAAVVIVEKGRKTWL